MNLQYMFLEANKEKDFGKFMPTIMNKLYESEIFGREFLMEWSRDEIKDIDKNYMYSEERNEQFKKMIVDFLEYVEGEEEEEEGD